MKKLLPLLVVGILVLTGLGASATPFYDNSITIKWKQNNFTNTLKGDVLDQSQLDMDWFGPIGPFPLAGGANYIIAQTFKPTKPVLTRVELMIGKNSTTTYDYTVAIRNALNGSDLTSVSIPAEQIVTENFSWIEFNFPDIAVTPGDTYYIVSYTVNATDNWYAWGMKTGNAYPNGTIYYTTNDGATWDEEPNGDMTFKTYGRSNSPPDIPSISGKTKGKVYVAYEYTFVATDSDGDDVYYYIEWGDGEVVEWMGPNPSGEPVHVNHTFTSKGTFIIRAKAKDVCGAESDWGYLEVSIPRTYTVRNSLLFRLMEKFQHAFPILRYILKV
ncbi:MAG: hypothetical protein QHH19_06905 [Candidatus Thermoplasmatota archaeon]|jgi:hypothetical protein|nr:hypothetical protein [Candidatus Thermoplasmatota archaeon]